MTTVKKVKIFADDSKNNIYLIQTADGGIYRGTTNSRFFERKVVTKDRFGTETIQWVNGCTPKNEIKNILDAFLTSGEIGEVSHKEAYPEHFKK